MFDWFIKIKWDRGKVEEWKMEPIVWYDGPRSMIDRTGKYLLEWYEDLEDKELWFLIENRDSIIEHLKNKKSLKSLLLEGKTWLVEYSFEDDIYYIKRLLTYDELIQGFELPAEDSFIGNLYANIEELLSLVEDSKKEYEYYVVDYNRELSVEELMDFLKNNCSIDRNLVYKTRISYSKRLEYFINKSDNSDVIINDNTSRIAA